MQEKEQESMEPGLVFFIGCGRSFAWLDLDMFSWKTYQRSLLGDWDLYSKPYPKAGIMRNGRLYQREPVEHLIGGIDGGLWPTPTASQAGMSKKRKENRKPDTLKEAVKQWPTPTQFGNHNRASYNSRSGDGLSTAVKQWPTPIASDSKMASRTLARLIVTGELLSKGHKLYPKHIGDNIRLWPTPTATTSKGVGPLDSKSHEHHLARGYLGATVQEAEEKTGYLNADWVDPLMGYLCGYTKISGSPCLEILPVDSWLDGSWELDIPRLTTRNPNRSKRLKGLGNSVVPQCVAVFFEMIGNHHLASLQ